MMRVKVGENQYKKIVELLKSINIVKISGGGGAGMRVCIVGMQ